MNKRIVALILGASITVLGQLPDREALIEQLKDPATSRQAFSDLVVHYQLGGVRSIVRNLNQMPLELRIACGRALMHLDLFRYRNDLNANLEEAQDPESKALFLQMMATFGRQLDLSVFDPYLNDEKEDIRVRLAAAAGTIKIQNPAYYNKFYEVAKKAEYDPGSGRDDFEFCDLHMSNQGFYFYTQGKLTKEDASDAIVYTAIRMAQADSRDLYQKVLDLKWKKFVPLMIDRAVRVGGIDLLTLMEDHKTAKKMKDEISKAKGAASTIAKYRSMGVDLSAQDQYPIAASLPRVGGTGVEGLPAAYGVAHVMPDGKVDLIEYLTPFGGSDQLKSTYTGYHAIPAFKNFEPVESYALIVAP